MRLSPIGLVGGPLGPLGGVGVWGAPVEGSPIWPMSPKNMGDRQLEQQKWQNA